MHRHKLSNKEILAKLDESIYGHENAKKILINSINRSKLRWSQEFEYGMNEGFIPNKNVLLIGPSGSGKTYLVEKLQDICDFPLVRLDATQLNPAGASGGTKIETIVKEIESSCAFWAKQSDYEFTTHQVMRKLVVFIDEIDKLAQSFDSSGNWNKHVQANLLQLIDGKIESVQGVTFIFAGAFTSIFNSRIQNSLGFVQRTEKAPEEEDWDTLVTKAGLLAELVGRLESVVVLDALRYNDYEKILENYLIPEIQKHLVCYNFFDFNFSEDEKKALIERVIKSGQGVRKLKKELWKMVEMHEFEFEEKPAMSSVSKLLLSFDIAEEGDSE